MIATLTIHLHLPACASLKEKRRRILEQMLSALAPFRHDKGVRYPETTSVLVGWR